MSFINASKAIFLVFVLYMAWYKEIWGDFQIVLYGSVFLLTISTYFSADAKGELFFEFRYLTGFYKVLLAFGIYCFITGLVVSIYHSLLIDSMTTYFSYLVVLLDCCLISKLEDSWEWLLNDFIVVSLVCVVYTIFWGKPMLNGGATVYTMSKLNNPHTLAFVLLMGIFGLLAKNQKNFDYVLLKMIIILLLLYGILITGSRKSLISIAIFFSIWTFNLFQMQGTISLNPHKVLVFLVVIIALIIAVWYFRRYYVGTDQFSRLMRLFGEEEDNSNQERIRMYEVAFKTWKEHFLFGVGFNQYQLYSWRGDYSHSTYAEVFSCTGIIGAAILFIPVLNYLFQMIRYTLISNNDNRYYYLVCLAGLSIELFLGIGQIWIYGFFHELFLICICGVFSHTVNLSMQSEFLLTGEKQKWKYLL